MQESFTFTINISDYIDIELSAMFKTLFNGNVVNPTEETLHIVEQALHLFEGDCPTDTKNAELSYFINTWFN